MMKYFIYNNVPNAIYSVLNSSSIILSESILN